MRRLVISVATAMLLLPAGGMPARAAAPARTATTLASAGAWVCTIEDDRLSEISGLVATETGYVAINDGSDLDSRRRIFFLDRSCAVTRAVPYPSRPRDTEDLARGRDGTLWIGDIGDNGRSRDTVALWKLAPNGRTPVLHRLRYPDGAHDAEALLLNRDGTPVIVTKDADTPGLYVPTRAPQAGRTVPMRRVGQFTLPRSTTRNPFYALGRRVVTGAALAPDGRRVVLRSYADAFEFDVTDGDVPAAITGGAPRITPLPDEPQGESITYSTDGTALLTVSETGDQSPGTGPVILRYTPSAGPGPVPATPTDSPASGGAGAEEPAARPGGAGFDNRGLLVGAAGVIGLLLVAAMVLAVRRARRPDAPGTGRGRP
jgi:hypothetical protein